MGQASRLGTTGRARRVDVQSHLVARYRSLPASFRPATEFRNVSRVVPIIQSQKRRPQQRRFALNGSQCRQVVLLADFAARKHQHRLGVLDHMLQFCACVFWIEAEPGCAQSGRCQKRNEEVYGRRCQHGDTRAIAHAQLRHRARRLVNRLP